MTARRAVIRGRDFVWWLGGLGRWDVAAPAPGTENVTISVSGAPPMPVSRGRGSTCLRSRKQGNLLRILAA
ncbi:MAG: hypothetical protein Q4P24_03370 [Rhodobacterales bacterium]|nr:hypothetical protein [Rhodobacterales bacterium]